MNKDDLRGRTKEFALRTMKLEFIAKIGVVEEEADEGAFWLELVIEHKLMQEVLVRPRSMKPTN